MSAVCLARLPSAVACSARPARTAPRRTAPRRSLLAFQALNGEAEGAGGEDAHNDEAAAGAGGDAAAAAGGGVSPPPADDAADALPATAGELRELIGGVLREQIAPMLREQEQKLTTQMGHLFGAIINGGRRDLNNSFSTVPQLLSACGLPISASGSVFTALATPEVLHMFRGGLLPLLLKIKEPATQTAVAGLEALPPKPDTAAEWRAEEKQAIQVLRTLRPGTPLHDAMFLWRDCCMAAGEDAAPEAAQPSALQQLLKSGPAAYGWEPDMGLLMARAGLLQPELALDTPLQVAYSPQGHVVEVTVEEAKLNGQEAGSAKLQLTGAIGAIAWLFETAGHPLPSFHGIVIVPSAEKRRASGRCSRISSSRWRCPAARPASQSSGISAGCSGHPERMRCCIRSAMSACV